MGVNISTGSFLYAFPILVNSSVLDCHIEMFSPKEVNSMFVMKYSNLSQSQLKISGKVDIDITLIEVH